MRRTDTIVEDLGPGKLALRTHVRGCGMPPVRHLTVTLDREGGIPDSEMDRVFMSFADLPAGRPLRIGIETFEHELLGIFAVRHPPRKPRS